MEREDRSLLYYIFIGKGREGMYVYKKAKKEENAVKAVLTTLVVAAGGALFKYLSNIESDTINIQSKQDERRIRELESKRFKTKAEKAELKNLKK